MDFINERKNPKSILIPTFIKISAQVLQFFSKSLATKFATKLFITPVNFPIPKREKALYKSAQKKRLQIPAIDKEIDLISYGYSKKKVLFVHGWAGRGTQLFLTADKLLEKGYMMIAFDGPAHGKSTGKTTSLPEFVATIQEVNAQYGPFDIAIGHSFGGLCLYNAVNEGFEVQKLITIGAADKIEDVLLNFAASLDVKPVIGKKIKQAFDKQWNKNIDEHAASEMAKSIDIPTLVIHESCDGDVDVSCALNIRQNLKNGELYITNGLGHTKILRAPEVSRKIIDFIVSDV